MIQRWIPVFLLFWSILCTVFLPARAQTLTNSPVLIELYTAENCPYCPPADELMAKLSQLPDIIGISCHVDYFGAGRLNLPRGFCRERQEYYVGQKLASRIYTPMVIINGRYEAIGYQGDKVSAALMKARGDAIAPITIQKGEGLMFTISLPALQTHGADISLWMMMIDKPHMGLALPSRNNGKPITYVNAAGLYQTLGKWDGTAQIKQQPLMVGGVRKGLVIAAQDNATGKILAAGKYDF